jgi:putative peptidoglycan lipid II flippase
MTLISRLLGFVRDMLIARIFGVDLATDAFFVAFKIPNLFRRLFAEGAFAHVFVPVLSANKTHGNQDALKLLIERTAGTLAVILFCISLAGMLVAPLLIWMLAPGFAWQGSQHDLAVKMLQITLPYLFFIGLVAFAGSVLNVHNKFAVSALTPVFLNITMIAAAIWLAPKMDVPVIALAWGVFAAGAVQLLFQIPSLVRLGLIKRFRMGFHDPEVSKILGLMLPAIFSVSITQINLLVDTLIASFLKAGSVSWLYYSDRLVEFPLGLLGLALGVVILPSLSRSHATEDMKVFSDSLNWGLRLVLLIGMPATIGLFLLAEPMLSTLFQYKEFSVSDVYYSGLSLKAYSLGLVAYIAIKVLVSGFTSRHDVKTPVRYGMYAMTASLGLNVVLVYPLAHAGLALATSLGAFINAALLLRKLLKDNVFLPALYWRIFIGRILLASIVMSATLYYQVDVMLWSHWGGVDRMLNLIKWIMIGGGVYVGMLFLVGFRYSHLK